MSNQTKTPPKRLTWDPNQPPFWSEFTRDYVKPAWNYITSTEAAQQKEDMAAVDAFRSLPLKDKMRKAAWTGLRLYGGIQRANRHDFQHQRYSAGLRRRAPIQPNFVYFPRRNDSRYQRGRNYGKRPWVPRPLKRTFKKRRTYPSRTGVRRKWKKKRTFPRTQISASFKIT